MRSSPALPESVPARRGRPAPRASERARLPAPRQAVPSAALGHTPRLRLGEDIAVRAPHHQGGAGHALEDGPQRGPRRGTLPHALLDIGGIHLPGPAAVGARPEHTQRQLSLIFLAAAGDDRRHLASVGHRVLQRRELVRPAADRLGDPLGTGFHIGTDVVNHQAQQTIRVRSRVCHRDDATHRGADQREPGESKLLHDAGEVADLVPVLVGPGRGPGTLPVAAHVGRDDVEAIMKCRAGALNAWALDV